MRVLIVDDEPLARERIRSLLAAEPDVQVVGECGDGGAAVDAIRDARPDLVFLDVQMPDLDGFGVLDALAGEELPLVVFVTAYDQYALRAFEAHAVDYLLKPYDVDRFAAALARARANLGSAGGADVRSQLLSLLQELRPNSRYLERLIVRLGSRLLFVRAEEIDWIEAEGNYARLHAGNRSYLVRETMSHLEAKLDPAHFVRIHRSSIVNVDRIQELESVFQGEYLIVLRGGTKLNSSRGYRERLEKLLGIGT